MNWNRFSRILITAGLAGALGWMSLSAGCNPQFVSSLGTTQNLPTTPGNVDYVQVRFYNAATMQVPGTGIGFSPMWRYAGGTIGSFGGVGDPGLVQGEDIGQLIPCNVTVITLGDVNDLTVSGAWVSYNPPLDPVRRRLQPLGKVLQNGVDFRCGDTITFIAVNNSSAREGYSLTYNIQSGQNQPDTFSGPDAFALFEKEARDFETMLSQGMYPWY